MQQFRVLTRFPITVEKTWQLLVAAVLPVLILCPIRKVQYAICFGDINERDFLTCASMA